MKMKKEYFLKNLVDYKIDKAWEEIKEKAEKAQKDVDFSYIQEIVPDAKGVRIELDEETAKETTLKNKNMCLFILEIFLNNQKTKLGNILTNYEDIPENTELISKYVPVLAKTLTNSDYKYTLDEVPILNYEKFKKKHLTPEEKEDLTKLKGYRNELASIAETLLSNDIDMEVDESKLDEKQKERLVYLDNVWKVTSIINQLKYYFIKEKLESINELEQLKNIEGLLMSAQTNRIFFDYVIKNNDLEVTVYIENDLDTSTISVTRVFKDVFEDSELDEEFKDYISLDLEAYKMDELDKYDIHMSKKIRMLTEGFGQVIDINLDGTEYENEDLWFKKNRVFDISLERTPLSTVYRTLKTINFITAFCNYDPMFALEPTKWLEILPEINLDFLEK